jgi:hypothetical protein
MAKQTTKTERFDSFGAWRENYFPEDIKSEALTELQGDAKNLGVALANSTFDRLMAKNAAKKRAG